MTEPLGSDEKTKQPEYAGFWLRVAASLIDGPILAGVGFIVENVFASWLGSLLNLIIPLVYFVGFNSSAYQGTVGKIAMGIKITDLNGSRISWARALARFCFPYIFIIIQSLCMIYFLVAAYANNALEALIATGLLILSCLVLIAGYIMTGLTARKQALHDIVCSTLVIKAAESIHDESPAETGIGRADTTE